MAVAAAADAPPSSLIAQVAEISSHLGLRLVGVRPSLAEAHAMLGLECEGSLLEQARRLQALIGIEPQTRRHIKFALSEAGYTIGQVRQVLLSDQVSGSGQ